jgi:Acetyltransferase (GNAT) domain
MPLNRHRDPVEQQHVVQTLSVHVESKPDPGGLSEWDQLVSSTPGTDVTQLSARARVRAHVGYLPLYIFLREEGRLVGGVQLLHHDVLRMSRIGYVPYGPLIAPGRNSALTSGLLADGLARLGTQLLHALFVQPPEGAEPIRVELLNSGFRPSRTVVASVGSLRVDVQVDESELRARARRRLRPAQKLWEKYRVTTREGGQQDLQILARLLACSARVHGFQPFKLDYLQALYRELLSGGHVVLLIGEADGVPLAADLLTINAGMLRGRFMGFDRSGSAPQAAVPAAVTWAGINWAKDHGLRWYDMGGLQPSVLSDMIDRHIRHSPSWPSTALAKLGWGAVPFRYPSPIEFVRPAALRWVYEHSQGSPTTRRFTERAARLMRG